MKSDSNNISRRDFMKLAAFAAAGIGLGGCSTDGSDKTGKNTGAMTLRENPNTGDKVSVLGYGCMRLPTVTGQSAQKDNADIDQDEVNRQVD